MGGVEDPSDEAAAAEEKKEDKSEEAEDVTDDDNTDDINADEEESDEIILTSNEDEPEKYEAVVAQPNLNQAITLAPLQDADDFLSNVNISQEVETPVDEDEPVVDITIDANNNKIPATDVNDTTGYYVGIQIPTYDGFTLAFSGADSATTADNTTGLVYYKRTTGWAQEYADIIATYTNKSDDTDQRKFKYHVTFVDCNPEAITLLPTNSSAVRGLKASVKSVSEGQVAANFTINAQADEPVDDLAHCLSMNSIVAAGNVTRSKNESNTDGYWVSLAVPTIKADDLTVKYAIVDSHPGSPSYVKVTPEVTIDGKLYKTISVNMAEYDEKDNTTYIYAKYEVDKNGYKNDLVYLYKITFDYTKNNGIPSAPEAAIHVLKDAPKGDDQDPGYTVNSSVSGNGTIVVDVGAASAVKPYTVSGANADGNGYWVGIAFPGYGTGVSENKALTGDTGYKAGTDTSSLSTVSLKKSAKTGESAYKVDNKFYDLFYVNLNSLTNGVEYVDVTYTSASTSETKTYHYLFDFSDIQLYTGLPTIDQMVQGVEAAPLSASATEAAQRAKNYRVSTPEVSGNVITVKVTADDVVKGKVSGNDTSAYYVGVTIPALATADADFSAEYSADTTDAADYVSKKLNAAISSNGVLKTAANNAGTEGTDATKDVVKQRVAYFDVTTAGKKGYVYVQYKNKKIVNKTVEYKYIVDFSDVTMSNSLPRIDDVKKITFVNSKNAPKGETVDAGFTTPDVSVTGVNELTISANNTKAFRYFTVSSDDVPTDSFFDKNDHWVAVAIPGYGKGVSGNEVTDVLKDTKYTVNTISENKGEHYKTDVKIGEKYYDVFYLDASEDDPIYVINATYTNKETPVATIEFSYKIDLSKVLYDDDLPDNVEASFIPLKDSKGVEVNPGYSLKADSKNPVAAYKTVSVNNTTAMAPYRISGNEAKGNGYWVAMAVPANGTGLSSNELIASVKYGKGTTSGNSLDNLTEVTASDYVKNYKAADGKYYDLFYLNLANEADQHFFFTAEYTNRNATADVVRYHYEYDFSKFLKDNGIPTAAEVSAKDSYIKIADPVAENIITEPYAIGDIDVAGNTITVSVNAAGLRAAEYTDIDGELHDKTPATEFWAGVKVKAVSANEALPYTVTYSFDNSNYHSSDSLGSDWVEKNFDIDGGEAAIWVKYTNKAVTLDTVTYKYVLNFTGITKDMKPAGIDGVTTVALNDKNDDENPYSTNTVTASADTQTDNVITVPVKVTNEDLKFYVEKDKDTLGYGYWTGIALPQSLKDASSTPPVWTKGLGEFNAITNAGSSSTFEGDFASNKNEIAYGNFLFNAEEVKNDHAGKAFVAIKLAEGSNITYVVYDLDFSNVTLSTPEVEVETAVSTDGQVLFEKSAVTSDTVRNVEFTVKKGSAALANTTVQYEVIDNSNIASVDVATAKKRATTDSNGMITIPLKIAANPSTTGVITVNLTVGDNAGGASYSIEVYEKATPITSIALDLTDESEGILNPSFILAADSQFATSYAIKSGDADAIKLDTATGEITALDKTATAVVVSQNIVDKNGKPVNNQGKNTGSYITTDDSANYSITVGASYSSAEIEIVDDNFYVDKVSSEALKLNFTPGKYTPVSPNYSWQSTNNAIAIIQSGAGDSLPVIKGVKAGTVTITCTYSDSGKTVTVKKQITVKEPLGDWTLYYNGTTKTNDTSSFTVPELGKSIKLVAKLDAGSKKVIPATWTSSDTGVVSFGTDATSGIMETVATGTATVTATAADGTKHTISVIVTDDDSVEVGVSPTAVALKKAGDTTLITPTLTHSKTVASSISADSANTSVATVSVSSNGQVIVKAETAKKSSTTVNVYYKGSDGKNHNYATVNVTTGSDPVKATGIKADVTNASIYIGNTYSFAYTVTPANYTDAVLKWSSADPGIATVDQTSGVITGIAKGEATILLVIENSDGSKIAKEFTVNVKAVPAPEAIAISPKSLTLTAPAGNNATGGEALLTAKVSPSDATQTVKWTSSNVKVATVEETTGLVKATGVGTAEIEANTGAPYYYGESITVTVVQTVETADNVYYGNAFNEDDEPQAWMGVLKDEEGNTSFTYTGSAIKPVPNVYYGDLQLVAGTDYTYSYKNNINAATGKNKPTVTVKLKGNYSGTLTREFSILPRDIAEATANNVSAVIKTNKKTGTATEQLLKPVLTFNGKTLKENKDGNADYRLYYLDEDEDAYAAAGTYAITIVGTGNYTGETAVDEVIIAAADANNMSKAKLAFDFGDQKVPAKNGYEAKKAYYNNGEEIVPNVTVTYGGTAKVAGVTLEEGTDYTMTITNNVNLGKATVTITGIGGSSGYYGTKKDTFTIVPKVTALNESTDDKLVIKLNDVATTVNSKTVGKKLVAEETNNDVDATFIKGGVKPSVTVTYDGKDLTAGTDYKVTYKGGKYVGDYSKSTGGSVVITGIGKFYKGTATVNYSIDKADISEMTFVVDDYVATAKTLANYAKKFSVKAYDLDGKALKGASKVGDTSVKNDFYIGTDYTQLTNPAIGDVVTLKVHGVGNYDGETSVDFRIVDNNTIKTLKGAKYAFLDKDGNEVKSNKYYVKYAGTPVVLTQNDLIIRVNKKVGRTTQLEQLDNSDYEIILFENNNKVGTSKITIRGVGDYAGLFTLTYRITNK